MRDRELTAAAERRRVDSVLAEARARGRSWAVLTGPADPAELAEGECVAVHLPSSTALSAGVDPWSGAPPFRLRVAADGRCEEQEFTDRAQWLAAYAAARAELDRDRP
jgi:hypothetical protein